MGIYLAALGIKDTLLFGVGTASQVACGNSADLPDDAHWLIGEHLNTSSVDAQLLYNTNDLHRCNNVTTREFVDLELTPEEQEARIAAIFALHDVKVTFIN